MNRKHVSKGRYNKYLREVEPLEHAPLSSKRIMLSEECIEDVTEMPNKIKDDEQFVTNQRINDLEESLPHQSSTDYYQSVRIAYSDGLILEAILSKPDVSRLDTPGADKEHLLQTIRSNAMDRQQETEEAVSDMSDIEAERSEEVNPTFSWGTTETNLLISLYAEHEDEMEDRRTKKKDVWKKITGIMKSKGHTVTAARVEQKWINLLKSHKGILVNKKGILVNKKGTGSKRKSFQYFAEIDEIIAKRHDINPPFLGGSGIKKTPENGVLSAKPRSNPSPNISPSSPKPDNGNEDEDFETETSLNLSTSSSAKKRRLTLRLQMDESNAVLQTLKFLKECHDERKKLHNESEQRKDKRAEERNAILQQFINTLKN